MVFVLFSSSFLQFYTYFVFLFLHLMAVKYTPQWRWLAKELKRVDRDKTPWLIVLMHVPMYNSNDAHFMEGESMRVVFESWFCHYKVDIVFAGHVHAYERSVSLIFKSSPTPHAPKK